MLRRILCHRYTSHRHLAIAALLAACSVTASAMAGWAHEAAYALAGPVVDIWTPIAALVAVGATHPRFVGKFCPMKGRFDVLVASVAMGYLGLWLLVGPDFVTNLALGYALGSWGIWMLMASTEDSSVQEPAYNHER